MGAFNGIECNNRRYGKRQSIGYHHLYGDRHGWQWLCEYGHGDRDSGQ